MNAKMDNKEKYIELINAILSGKLASFGQMGLDKANEVEGLKVDDGGKVVLLAGDAKQILDNLLHKFEEIAGKSATISSKIFAQPILKKYPDLVVPQALA